MLLRIAIDGPAGAGKSTVARIVAERLGCVYIDTGAMYRALTLEALDKGIDLTDQIALVDALRQMNLTIEPGRGGNQIFIRGANVTARIREPLVSQNVSLVSSHKAVREAIVEMQQEMARHDNVVMDGRDIGTVVMPDADYKFFLSASVEVRAQRRQLELARKGYDVPLGELIEQIKERDHFDSTRENSPLKKAVDAIEIDATNLTIDEVVDLILLYCRGRNSDV